MGDRLTKLSFDREIVTTISSHSTWSPSNPM
jgi:hypothetical protein